MIYPSRVGEGVASSPEEQVISLKLGVALQGKVQVKSIPLAAPETTLVQKLLPFLLQT